MSFFLHILLRQLLKVQDFPLIAASSITFFHISAYPSGNQPVNGRAGGGFSNYSEAKKWKKCETYETKGSFFAAFECLLLVGPKVTNLPFDLLTVLSCGM